MTVGSKVKQTLSSLQSIKSTIEIYAVQSRNEEAAHAFREAEDVLGEVVNDLEKRVQTLEFEEPQYKGL